MSNATMRAGVIVRPGAVEVREVPAPLAAAGQVRVRIEGCGVCGSSLPLWEGRPWWEYPREAGAPGHEGWGHIDQVGEDVPESLIGRRVAVLSYSAFAQYDVAPVANVVQLPAALDDQPFPGEAMGCAMNIFKRSNVRAGQTVAIVGAGFLGLLLVQLAARAGARVIAITRRQFALDLAAQSGATLCIPMRDHQAIITQVEDVTRGRLCDVVIEAVGEQWPLDLASAISAERGRLVIAGYHQDARQVNMQQWNWRGLDVINAHERASEAYVQGIRDAVDAVSSKKLDPTPLYTRGYPLAGARAVPRGRSAAARTAERAARTRGHLRGAGAL